MLNAGEVFAVLSGRGACTLVTKVIPMSVESDETEHQADEPPREGNNVVMNLPEAPQPMQDVSNIPRTAARPAKKVPDKLTVEMGEELLAQGDLEGGTEHLANAVAVCGQPHQLLQVLQTTLPPHVFHLLLQRLPATGQ
ncbi:hypothetical protein QAD02_007427, partial [Eretmocerus hayati]